jgi:PAS domain S-box-containing protein
VHDSVTNIIWVVYGATALLLAFFIAFVLVVMHSHRHKLRMQHETLTEIRKSEEKYRTLFHHSLAGMIKFNYETFETLDANEALLEMFTCNTLAELYHSLKKIVPAHRAYIRTELKNDRIINEYEFSFVDKDEHIRWMLFSARSEQEEKIAYGVFRDITRRKMAEETIEEQAALLNQTRDAVIVVTMDGEILFWNKAAVEMYGWEAHEVIGKNIGTVLFQSDHHLAYQACREDVTQFGEWNGEQRQRVKNNKHILVESNWKRIDNRISNTSAFLIVNTDITEKRALETSSLHNQKMEAIALMTSGIAHDLQNILAPVSLSITILRDNLVDPSRGYILDTIEESVNNGLRLVKNILMVGRGLKGVNRPVNLNTAIDSALSVFDHGKPETIAVEKKFTVQECRIAGDEDLLSQVFLNLFQNAKDAMPDGGTLSIVLAIMDGKYAEFVLDIESNEDAYAVVEVTDTGIGIPPEYHETIYEPFFTTKEGAGGTGLGLPIVRNIIKNHGGSIVVKSAAGAGTSFTIYFPMLHS